MTARSRHSRVALPRVDAMKPKSGKGIAVTHRLTILRQLVGRNGSRCSAGGREKRKLRRKPSLPQLGCLEKEVGDWRGHAAQETDS
jgi:hypothetical protein